MLPNSRRFTAFGPTGPTHTYRKGLRAFAQPCRVADLTSARQSRSDQSYDRSLHSRLVRLSVGRRDFIHSAAINLLQFRLEGSLQTALTWNRHKPAFRANADPVLAVVAFEQRLTARFKKMPKRAQGPHHGLGLGHDRGNQRPLFLILPRSVDIGHEIQSVGRSKLLFAGKQCIKSRIDLATVIA